MNGALRLLDKEFPHLPIVRDHHVIRSFTNHTTRTKVLPSQWKMSQHIPIHENARKHVLHSISEEACMATQTSTLIRAGSTLPGENRRAFVNFYGMTTFYWRMGILLLGPATVWTHYTIALLCAPLHTAFFTQYVFIIVHTLRYVMAQPSVPDDSITTPNKSTVLTMTTFI